MTPGRSASKLVRNDVVVAAAPPSWRLASMWWRTAATARTKRGAEPSTRHPNATKRCKTRARCMVCGAWAAQGAQPLKGMHLWLASGRPLC